MNKMIKRVLNRAKNLAVLLLLIPILTAGAGYIFAAQLPEGYTASSKILMGNYENQKRTNPNIMKGYVTTTKYLEKLNENYKLDLNVQQVKSRFTTNANQQENTLELTYRGPDKEDVEETLRKLTDAIIAEGTELYDEKLTSYRETLDNISIIETEVEEVAKEDKLLDYTIGELDFVNSEIVEDVTVNKNSTITPMQSAILGFLIGLILSVLIVILPELFREEKN
jgi:teichuronic acid biosynthesis protein TuaF